MESLVSREATFLYNNLLLVALALTILWGVAFPILSEAVRGEQITVGAPYYNFFLRVFGLPLLLLMAIGPLVAWRRASLRSLGRSFAWPAGIAVAVGLLLLLLGAGSSWIGLVAYTFSAFVLASISYEFVRGTRARRALMGGSWAAAFVELVARNRRRYGGYVVHASIVLLAIGVVGSSAYDTVREQMLSPGQSMAVANYDLTYRRLVQRDGPNANEIRAVVDVRRGGDSLGSLAGRKEPLPRGGPGLERGRDPQRLPHRRGPLRDHRPDQHERHGRLQGARQAAREPDLAGRLRVRRGLAHRPVAERGRAAPSRGALPRAARARAGMTVLALVVGALLVCACVAYVALPFLREPDPEEDVLAEPGALERRALELAEERDRALAALKELEFDHRTGKISDDDYRELVGPLRRRVADALRALELRTESKEERVSARG